MAFNKQNFGRVTATGNTPRVVLMDAEVLGSNVMFSYSTTETIATVEGSNYFNPAYADLQAGDVILVVASDASSFFSVTSVTGEVVVISSFAPAGVIGTANIQDSAVTTAKINNLAVTTAKLADGAVTSAKLASSVLQVASGTIDNTAVLALYDTPVQLVAAPGAGFAIVVDSLVLECVYASLIFGAGGNIYAQYNTTAHGSLTASANISPTGFADQTSNRVSRAAGAATGLASTAIANQPITLTNATANFGAGGGSFRYTIAYRVVALA